MSLLTVGSVAFDSIKTPFGKINKTLGGSASYFSLAASYFTKPAMVAVVGDDFSKTDEKIFANRKINTNGLQKAKGKTFAWGGEYSFDLNSRKTLFTHLNVFQNFRPRLSSEHQKSKYLFLGNIHPTLQLDVLRQAKGAKFVGLDTMNYWIENAPKQLAKVLKLVNILIINDSEARELAKEHNLMKAAKKIFAAMNPHPDPLPEGEGVKTLVIKRGEYGLLMLSPASERSVPIYGRPKDADKSARYKYALRTFHLPGYPLEDVLDPTGAGDSFAGGFFGYLAKTNDASWANLKKACVAGSAMASFCVEKLGVAKLLNLKAAHINQRLKEFKKLTHF